MNPVSTSRIRIGTRCRSHSDKTSFSMTYIHITLPIRKPARGYISYPLSGISSGEHTLKTHCIRQCQQRIVKDCVVQRGRRQRPGDTRPLDRCLTGRRQVLVFSASVDHPNTRMKCRLEVFRIVRQKSLAGRQLRHQRHAGRHADTMGSQG